MSNERWYPPQGYPQGCPPQGNPQWRWYPPQGYPQGCPPQGNPQGRWYPPQGYPQGCPPQGYLQGCPPQGYPQGCPPQGYPQGCPPQTHPRQGCPPQQGAFPQPQGYHPQGHNYLNAQPRQPQDMNHRPQNTYNQIGGDQNNPQNQGVGVIYSEGVVNLGSSSGATKNFNNQGSYADKQIQGVNGGSIHV